MSVAAQQVVPPLTAMKQALEALEWNLPVIEDYGDKEQLNRQHKAITSLRQAIREHALREVQRLGQEIEQEPVAWRAPNWGHSADEYVYRDFDDPVIGVDGKPSPNNEPLYTTPPQRTWVGLTDEEELKLAQDSMGKSRHWLVAQVEAKLKERNT